MKRFLPILAVALAATAVTAQVQWNSNDGSRLLNRAQWKAEQSTRLQAPARITQQWETLVEENFDKMTAGTNEQPDSVVITNPYVADQYTQTPGWSGIGVRQAGGAVCIGNPGWGTCILNTPEMEMQGLLRLSFRAKCLSDVKGFTINLDYNGINSPGVVLQEGGKVSATDNGWVDFEFTFYNPKDVPCFVQINVNTYGSDNGDIFDDFKLERTRDYVPSVSDMVNYNFRTDGFSSMWKPVAKAQSYLVSLLAEKTVGQDDQEKVWDFNEMTEQDNQLSGLPEGISVNLRGDRSHYTPDQGADSTPALVLSKEDEWIEIDGGGARIINLLFWYRGLASEHPQAGFWQCQLEGWNGSKWQPLEAFNDYSTTPETQGETMDYGAYMDEYNEEMEQQGGEPIAFRGMFTKVRIHPESLNYGVRLAIDDIDVVTEPMVETTTVVADQPVETNEYMFDAVDMTSAGLRYFVSVKAVNGDLVSEPYTAEAFGVAKPVVLPASDVNKDTRSFMANWEAMDNADAYMVTEYSCQKMAQDTPDFSIIAENFDNVHEEGCSTLPDEPSDMGNEWDLGYFDAYTQQPGWTGMGNCAIDGALGCSATWFAGKNFICTPALTLNNNEGNYSIHVRAYMQEGDCLMLTSTNLGAITDAATETGWTEWDVPMTDGVKNDKIYIQSANSETFLIDDFVITQDLSAGDLLLTPIKQVEAMDNSQAFDGAPEGVIGYDVMAGRQYYNLSAISTYSDTQEVNFDGDVAIDQTLAPHAVVSIDGLVLTITTPQAAAVEVFNIAGQAVASASMKAGINTITLPAQGVYVVTVDGKTHKVMAK